MGVANTVLIRYGIGVKSWERLLEVAGTQRGFVTPRNAVEVDVNPVELRKMAGRGRLEHLAQGLYRFAAFPRAANDELLQAVLWTGGRAVVSHESALALYALCDVNPRFVHVTIPPGYRPRRRGGELYRMHSEALDPTEVEEYEGIAVVTPAKAIGQGATSGVDPQLVEQAIATGRRRDLITRSDEAMLRTLLSGKRAR